MEATCASRIIRKKELLTVIGLSDATVYRLEKAGRFPKRLQLGGNSVGWLAEEVNDWIMAKAEARGAV